MIKEVYNNEITLIQPDYYMANDALECIINNQAYLKKWLPWANQNFNIKKINLYIEIYKNNIKENKEFCYYIFHRNDNKLIGFITFRNIDLEKKSAELGYWLDSKYTGHGYIIKSFNLVKKHLHFIPITTLFARTYKENVKSISTLERLNFIITDNTDEYDSFLFQYTM